jgi:uncharacterized DUF497 family protein
MATVVLGDFEWDSAKAQTNRRKHGVAFEEAMECFLDPHAITAPDRLEPSRFVLIGMSQHSRLLFVVSVEAGENIRIISARRASPQQRKVYENGPKA